MVGGETEGYIEERIPCPVCGREAVKRSKKTYTWLGLVRIESISCGYCGYRHVDEIVVEPREYGPEEIVVVVRSEEDLRRYLFKSRNAVVEFPDLGIEIFPGPDSRDEVYPIEGLIERYVPRIEAACPNTDDPARCREVVDYLKKVVEDPSIGLVIVIRDPTRYSRLVDRPGSLA